jgi:hypothetical protein
MAEQRPKTILDTKNRDVQDCLAPTGFNRMAVIEGLKISEVRHKILTVHLKSPRFHQEHHEKGCSVAYARTGPDLHTRVLAGETMRMAGMA